MWWRSWGAPWTPGSAQLRLRRLLQRAMPMELVVAKLRAPDAHAVLEAKKIERNAPWNVPAARPTFRTAASSATTAAQPSRSDASRVVPRTEPDRSFALSAARAWPPRLPARLQQLRPQPQHFSNLTLAPNVHSC